MSQQIKQDSASATVVRSVRVAAGEVKLEGDLNIPPQVQGMVLFAHGSGSGRHSPRNPRVAADLNSAGLATLLIDLLSVEEEAIDQHSGHLRFDVSLLADRLVGAAEWFTRFLALKS